MARETATGTAWFLADRLGSVRTEYGALASAPGVRTDYDPFGTPEGGPGLASPTDYGFAGEPQDPATGLVHLRARWYAPGSAQFTARDPFGGDQQQPLSFNPYAYAHADPVNLTDPTGLFVGLDPGGGGGGVPSSPSPAPSPARGGSGVACRDGAIDYTVILLPGSVTLPRPA